MFSCEQFSSSYVFYAHSELNLLKICDIKYFLSVCPLIFLYMCGGKYWKENFQKVLVISFFLVLKKGWFDAFIWDFTSMNKIIGTFCNIVQSKSLDSSMFAANANASTSQWS